MSRHRNPEEGTVIALVPIYWWATALILAGLGIWGLVSQIRRLWRSDRGTADWLLSRILAPLSLVSLGAAIWMAVVGFGWQGMLP